ncbi:MAG: pyridoxine 5'-phosphate synthase [Betaproteobacteria bacterium]|jgi:pyridoxine 5-phosphate synthase|nr:pyridoxine 5'-phosphate synthase [Betaproteobacteria bacterium]
MNPLVAPEAHASAHAGRTALSVNVNRIALLRNTRPVGLPQVARLAVIALEAGADGITVHPRPDARHITSDDVWELARLLKQWPQAEFNVEGNPFHNLMDLLRDLHAVGLTPQQATLVPDSVEQATSDHGWNLTQDGERLRPLIAQLQAMGMRVSLFMDPQAPSMRMAKELGADRVELYTEAYARAHGTPQQPDVLAPYVAAAAAAQAVGLGLNAGHDLNRDNLPDFLRAVAGVQEVSIGHALCADALEFGLAQTVKMYQQCIRGVPGE